MIAGLMLVSAVIPLLVRPPRVGAVKGAPARMS
jgi:hypothetical protein